MPSSWPSAKALARERVAFVSAMGPVDQGIAEFLAECAEKAERNREQLCTSAFSVFSARNNARGTGVAGERVQDHQAALGMVRSMIAKKRWRKRALCIDDRLLPIRLPE